MSSKVTARVGNSKVVSTPVALSNHKRFGTTPREALTYTSFRDLPARRYMEKLSPRIGHRGAAPTTHNSMHHGEFHWSEIPKRIGCYMVKPHGQLVLVSSMHC